MGKFLQLINEKINNSFENVKINEVVVFEKEKKIIFKLHYLNSLNENIKREFLIFAENYLKTDYQIEVKFKKYFFDEDYLKRYFINYIKENYNGTSCIIEEKDIIVENLNNKFNIIISVLQSQYDLLIENNLINKTKEILNNVFFETIDIVINQKENSKIIKELETHRDKKLSTTTSLNRKTNIKCEILDVIAGEILQTTALAPNSLDFAEKNVTICGKITNFSQNNYKSKRLDKENKPIIKSYFSFTLIDNLGKIDCVFFPRKDDNLEKLNLIKDDIKVIINGDSEFFHEQISFKIKAIALCDFEEVNILNNEYKKANNNYIIIAPQNYNSFAQTNLFEEDTEICDALKNKDYVVFDLETTGLEYNKHEIIEIGAVKISNGKIIETFTTLIKPKRSITQETIIVNGITNEMVKNSPSIEEVLPDFYKFCENCILVAHNMIFDFGFINHYGLLNNYKFENERQDTLILSRNKIKSLKRFNLKALATYLNVSLVNAHRAINDAMATAEIFIKLCNM